VGAELAETLAYAHDKGIIHRDIKPSNIIMTKDMRVKLTDFGIARIEDPAATTHTQVGAILGTPSYMSPEQVAGRRVDGRSDLFSLGVVLYEWLLGQRPFTGQNITAVFRAVSDKPPLPPGDLDPAVPQPLSDLLLKTLQKPVEERFSDGRQMAAALRSCLKATLPLGVPNRSATRRQKKGARRLISGMLLFVLITATVYVGGPKVVSRFQSTRVVSPPQEMQTQNPPPQAQAPATVAKASADVLVNSEPTGARIFINDEFRGTTPAELALPLGDYVIRIHLENHRGWEAHIQLSEPGQMPLFVKLTPN
jgi:serine/threonine-protein kinase